MGRAQEINIPRPPQNARLSAAARAHIDTAWRRLVEAAAVERQRLLDELAAARHTVWSQRMDAAGWQEKAERAQRERDLLFALLVEAERG